MTDFLGGLEQLVLLALIRLEPEAYGAAIWREIEKRAGRSVRGTTVYTALDRLAEKNFIESEWGEASPVAGGRPKKFYKLTDDGRGALEQSMQSVNSMQKGLQFGEVISSERLVGERVKSGA